MQVNSFKYTRETWNNAWIRSRQERKLISLSLVPLQPHAYLLLRRMQSCHHFPFSSHDFLKFSISPLLTWFYLLAKQHTSTRSSFLLSLHMCNLHSGTVHTTQSSESSIVQKNPKPEPEMCNLTLLCPGITRREGFGTQCEFLWVRAGQKKPECAI